MSNSIGKPMDRVDGRLKVTGAARYSAEIPVENVAHAVLVQSTIARGRIKSIDTREAERSPGVLGVLTHLNAPKLLRQPSPEATRPSPVQIGPSVSGTEGRGLLQDNIVHYSGQHIAVVIADTLEQATHAASLIRTRYATQQPVVDFEAELPSAFTPTPPQQGPGSEPTPPRGDTARALAAAAVRIDHQYTTPVEHHNPMAPFASIAVWDGPRLTVYDATQGVFNVRAALAADLGLPLENIRVISHFVGGAFGCGLRAWPHTTLTAMAARYVKRPVKLVLTREQMYTSVGYRNSTLQRVVLGAASDGKLTAIVHSGITPTPRFRDLAGGVTDETRVVYACPNLQTISQVVRLDVSQPTPMRAPGSAEGMFALECAMDELAYAISVDPIELRLRNHADVDPDNGNPWSSKSLKECYRLGAERIGWARRTPEPRSMRDGGFLVGLGMATAIYPANRRAAAARVRILADGTALVQTGASDIGPGTYTAMTQVAADVLGLPPERVRVELADSDLPPTPFQGGSAIMASVGSAVQEAALAARAKIARLARSDARSALRGVAESEVAAGDGRLFLVREPSVGETYGAILARQRLPSVEATVVSGAQQQPSNLGQTNDSAPSKPQVEYSKFSFGAQFAEVRVDPDLGEVRVTRFVGAYGAGRIVNPKTARSQMSGGIIGGIGMALMEHTVMDHNMGRYTNANLGEYHVPVNADIPDIDILFVDEHDPHVNPLGVKGVGEICLVGVAPAIANAIYHATGKRIRDLPIAPDTLL